jgi:hypothetical protein
MVETMLLTNAYRQKMQQYFAHFAGQVYCCEGLEKGLPYPLRTIQKIYDTAVEKSGIQRQGGIHSLDKELLTFITCQHKVDG